ncbi:SGNH/GDSL hydrolase family protein [Bradyrhizobium sediminis]|uniref:SGNH/GDSL hydrolase family protein n=1 Tax=Bradyrhizobium sediminis TaxID=2840469 RepID=A0A975NK76_9BRAD|nr:SGNH/GDSL hydrolase family protein [Bradyrhizobium sediminis]QWG16673.1 SGNH/GDSL hydrolase family protein [Bradyrhizobium sediminis]
MKHFTKPGRAREIFRSVGLSLGITLATLAALEIVLRIADFRELRETLTERALSYDYDAELGWAPLPNSSSLIKTFRTTSFKHNSLGLRDEEFSLDAKPTIMFLGDSFVWGLDSEASERFSDLLKPRIPGYKIMAAGVSGYGTDQEYLLLKRLWPKVKPAVVVLIFCAQNDRLDNVTNRRYDNYHKPYFTTQPDGSIALAGQPVPRSHLLYFRDNWLVRNLWLARLATNVYVRLKYPQVFAPDPTEKLVGKMREFVEGNGAKFLVGIQHHDEALVRYLEANRIPFVKLQGAEFYTSGGWGEHWTPEGQKDVAERVLGLLSANNIAPNSASAKDN